MTAQIKPWRSRAIVESRCFVLLSMSDRKICRYLRLALDRARAGGTATMPLAATFAGHAQGFAGQAIAATLSTAGNSQAG
jgi:hypothetical protein